MKITMRRLSSLCLVLLMISSVVLAQTGNTPNQSNPASEATTQNSRSEADVLREQQLRVFREHIFARTLDTIKRMDEPGLRLSARNQLLTYLSSDKALPDEKQTLVTQIAMDALADLREHGEEILPFMANYLSNDLGSWIQKHRPNLNEDFQKTIKANLKDSPSQRIRSLLALEGGDILAAQRIRQLLEEQGPLEGLYFWLDELMGRNSKEFEPLASEIAVRAGQGQVSFESLFWVSDIYLRPQVSETLRKRFLTSIVARTQAANFAAEPASQIAHQLLTRLLPFVRQSIPELYEQALNQSFAMQVSLSERLQASEARIKRLKESRNPIEDLVSEAESAKSKIESNELFLQAATLTVEKNKFDLGLDILSKVEVNVPSSEPDAWQRSIDQLLNNLIRKTLAGNNPALAERAAGRITSPLAKVEALQLIMRYWSGANDKVTAQRLLLEASKVAGTCSDNIEKARAFFLLSITCDQADGSKKAELLLSGIKALNDLSKPDSNARDKNFYQNYVRDLDNSGYELTRSFKGLTKQDQNGALALVERLQKPDLRTFALIGILQGLDGLPGSSW